MNARIRTKTLKLQAADATAALSSQNGGRLDSWKEIAAYLNRSTRCAQRWEMHLKLPVHRIRHIEGHTVYAYIAELETWRRSRERIDAPEWQRTEPKTAPAETEFTDVVPHCPGWSAALYNFYRVLRRRVPLRGLS